MWASALAPRKPQTFVYSLRGGQGARVQKAVLYNFGQGALNRYSKSVELQLSSDGTNFHRVATATLAAGTAAQTLAFPEQMARKVKLVVQSGYSALVWELAEFEVYGYPAQ